MRSRDRIIKAAQAVAHALGGNHLRYLDIVAVVLYADESVNNLEEWDYITSPEAKEAARAGVAEIRERVGTRYGLRAPKPRRAA